MSSLFDQYLKILNGKRKMPNIKFLTELLTSHIINIPFENISKLYYYKTKGLKNIPDFHLYLEGIEKNNFGGTCYSNNYYFNQLLNHLGFNAMLCGADMSITDAHLVNVVTFGNKKYLVDVGYGAPFLKPIPLNLKINYSIEHGNDKYVLFPANRQGLSELKQYRDNKIKHGYVVKPFARSISEFNNVIKDSFKNTSTFLNRITFLKFGIESSLSIRNYSFINIQRGKVTKNTLNNKEEIVEKMVSCFCIPENVVKESVYSIENL